MPISRLGARDKLIWGLQRMSCFLVRSAYYVDLNRRRRAKGETSNEMEQDDRWKFIWGMKVLGVVIMFLWKARNNILATRKNLFNKKIVENPCCPICQNIEETVLHVL